MPLSLLELIKEAKMAGLSPEDINLLVAKEEELYNKQLEREERQLERERKKHEAELIEATKKREHELALAKIRQDSNETNSSKDLFPGLKLMKFQDGKDEIDDFLKRFECMAEIQKWKATDLHVYLGSILSGKALKIYVSLPTDVQKDYAQLKEALLKGYSVDSDSYRKKFRESKVDEKESYVQLVTRMRQYLENWLTLSGVANDFESLFEFLVKDQLLSNCPLDLRVFLKERNFDCNVEMAQAADRYRSAHRSLKQRSKFQNKDDQVNKGNDKSNDKSDKSKSNVTCHHCKEPGHIRPNCPELASVKSKK